MYKQYTIDNNITSFYHSSRVSSNNTPIYERYLSIVYIVRLQNTRDWSLYLLDCAFSVGVVGTLVVFVWRGVWILFDLYLFPDDHEYSAIGSLVSISFFHKKKRKQDVNSWN